MELKYTSFEDFLIKETGLTLKEFLIKAKESVIKAKRQSPSHFGSAESYWKILEKEKTLSKIQKYLTLHQIFGSSCSWECMGDFKTWEEIHYKWYNFITECQRRNKLKKFPVRKQHQLIPKKEIDLDEVL